MEDEGNNSQCTNILFAKFEERGILSKIFWMGAVPILTFKSRLTLLWLELFACVVLQTTSSQFCRIFELDMIITLVESKVRALPCAFGVG